MAKRKNWASFNTKRKVMLKLLFLILLLSSLHLKAQLVNCTFKPPEVHLSFGTGTIRDLNATASYMYSRVGHSCPSDGHYAYTSYTSDCFRGDWITLEEDHTPGDASGNMMLVNASYRNGEFFSTVIPPLKSNTLYQFSIWMLNVCKPTDKCPFPLLPQIVVRLQTDAGKTVMQLATGELVRKGIAEWTEYKVMFTSPPGEPRYYLSMVNHTPGGCGNDFALDDVMIRECTQQPIAKAKNPLALPNKKTPESKTSNPSTAVTKNKVADPRPGTKVSSGSIDKKSAPTHVKPGSSAPAKSGPAATDLAKQSLSDKTKATTRSPVKPAGTGKQPSARVNTPNKADPLTATSGRPGGPAATNRAASIPASKEAEPASSPPPRLNSTEPAGKSGADSTASAPIRKIFAPPPLALTLRENPVIKKIETEAGEIKIDLYDNGEIDGDTVTIYHNNSMVVSRARLSQKPVTLRIAVDATQPHHELVMVANNLGSIPPNTSLMIVTAGTKRYEVYISSNEQNNAKIVVDLKR